jgi:hypothetical protein
MKKIILLIFSVGIVASVSYRWTPLEFSTSKGTSASLAAERFSKNRFQRSHHVSVGVDAELLETLQGTRSILDNLWMAMQEGHEAEMPDALKRVTDYLETHPEAISEALALLKSETDDGKISLLIPVLAECQNVEGHKLIKEAALELMEDALSSRRQMGLSLLAKTTPIESQLVQRILAVAQQDADNQIRIAAIDLLGLWLTQNPGQQDELGATLLQSLGTSNDEAVSGRVLQILAQQNVEPSEAILKVAAQFLNAASADNRIAAVMMLGQATGEMKNFAVEHLENAYGQEANVEVQKNILTQMVRIGSEEAPEILQRLSQNENSPLTADIEDYLQIIAEGKTASADEIYAQKFSLEAGRVTVAFP